MDHTSLQLLFWLCMLVAFWTYIGYYIFLRIYAHFASRKIDSAEIYPGVSIIITAHNEQKRIAAKLDSCLSLDYPRENLEIIVASDGSNDDTNSVVEGYRDKGVSLIAIPERNGKHFAQKKGIIAAKHEIVVLTDATTFLQPDSIRMIVRNFADPRVGCVSGKDEIAAASGPSQGEGLYVRYEMSIRALESQVSSLVGVSGSFFAVRKKICDTWFSDMSSDFFIPIVAYMHGFRSVLDEDAIGTYALVKDPEKEFHRKVRTIVHGLEVACRLRKILNPFKYGFYSFQMVSHKCLRWTVPFCLIVCLISNAYLAATSVPYSVMLVAQQVFYLAAVVAYLVKPLQGNALLRVPFFFSMVNISIIVAWWKYIRGERYVVWERTSR